MSQVSERYATALHEVTQAQGNTDSTLETLLALKTSMEDNRQVLDVLSTPLITDEEKEEVLKNAVGSGYTKELETFFKLLIKNNRLVEIASIVEAFQEKTTSGQGILSGTVKSAVELSDGEKAEIQSTIEKKLNKKVELQFSVDSQMIGGVEAKVGSFIFEDSIKTHMQKLNDFITRRVQ